MRCTAATLLAAGVLAFSTSALADTVTVHWDSSLFAPLGSQSTTFSRDAGAHWQTASAGRYQGTVTAASASLTGLFVDSTSDFWAYCADALQSLSGGGTYTYTVNTASSRTLDWLGAVNSVLGGGEYSWLHPSNTATAVAIQLGIWESLYDASGWSLASGTFRATGLNSATASAYAAFQTAVQNAATPDLESHYVIRLVNADSQDVISGRRAPEPGSMLLLALSVALAGGSLRRKR